MEYEFKFVLRSDDYHPVSIRYNNDIIVATEVLYLDSTSRFISITGDITPEDTGNVCLFTARIESENPSSWLNAAQTYAGLRYLEAEISMNEYKEPKVEDVAEKPEAIEENE
jgi:hypothetical protein